MKAQMLFLIAALCPFTQANALVYQCTKPDGKMEFRDSPCANTETQHFLPIAYHKTEHKTDKQTKLEMKQKKQETNLAKRESRSKLKTEKQKMKEEQKENRRLQRMHAVTEKINTIEAELKSGCKMKRFNSLKKELGQHQDKQRKLAGLKINE